MRGLDQYYNVVNRRKVLSVVVGYYLRYVYQRQSINIGLYKA